MTGAASGRDRNGVGKPSERIDRRGRRVTCQTAGALPFLQGVTRMGAETMTTADAPHRGALSGGCLCGAVRFHLTGDAKAAAICHCDECLHHNGGPSITIISADSPTIHDSSALSWWKTISGSDRGFCTTCGTHIFIRYREDGRILIFATALDDMSQIHIECEISSDMRPCFYNQMSSAAQIENAEVSEALETVSLVDPPLPFGPVNRIAKFRDIANRKLLAGRAVGVERPEWALAKQAVRPSRSDIEKRS